MHDRALRSSIPGEMRLTDYVSLLRRRWPWVAVPMVILLAGAAGWTATRPPTYRATAEVLLRSSAAESVIGGGSTNTGILAREISNEERYATSDKVEKAVEAELGRVPDIEVAADAAEADVLRFTAVAPSSDDAAVVANTWADAFVQQKQADGLASIDAASSQLVARLDDLRAQRSTLRAPLESLLAELAALPVNENSGQVIDVRAETLLRSEIDRVNAALTAELTLISSTESTVSQSLAALQTQAELARTATAEVVNRALPPLERSNPSLFRNLSLALILAVLAGGGSAAIRDNLDRAVKSPEQVERLTGLPVLSAVPHHRGRGRGSEELALSSIHHPHSAVADGYHKLRAALQFAMLDRPIGSILVTSPNQGEGKTVSAVNLAWVMASRLDRVALVDADLRRPRIHAVLGTANERGITDHVVAGMDLSDVCCYVQTADTTLSVVTTGTLPPNPSDFISSSGFARTLDQMKTDSELLVLDGPPVLPVSDALFLAGMVDAVLVVARAGTTHEAELQHAISSLRQTGGNVLGVILVGVKGGIGYGRYGYYGDDMAADRVADEEVRVITHGSVGISAGPKANAATTNSAERRRHPAKPPVATH